MYFAPDAFAGVFDENQIVLLGQGPHGVHIHCVAQRMHEHQRTGLLTDGLFDIGRLGREGFQMHVDKDRHATDRENWRHGRHPGDRGGDHLVAGPQAPLAECFTGEEKKRQKVGRSA